MAATYINSALKNNNFLAGTTDSVTINGVTNGNAVVGVVLWTNGSTMSGVADGDGSYTVESTDTTGSYKIAWFHKTISGSTGNKTITYTLSAGGAAIYAIFAVEITGHNSGDLFEAKSSNSQAGLGTGTDNATSNNVTPAANGAILIGFHGNQSAATSTVGADYTQRQTSATAWQTYAQTYEQATAAAHASTRSVTSGTATWISVVAAFNSASASTVAMEWLPRYEFVGGQKVRTVASGFTPSTKSN